MKVLAIESSCDDTSFAVVNDDKTVADIRQQRQQVQDQQMALQNEQNKAVALKDYKQAGVDVNS